MAVVNAKLRIWVDMRYRMMADSEVGKCGRFSRCLSFDGFPRLCWKSACETVRCAMLASY